MHSQLIARLLPGGSLANTHARVAPFLQQLFEEVCTVDTLDRASIATILQLAMCGAVLSGCFVFGFVEVVRKLRLHMVVYNVALLACFVAIQILMCSHSLYWVAGGFVQFREGLAETKVIQWLGGEALFERYSEELVTNGSELQWLMSSQMMYLLVTTMVFSFVEAKRCSLRAAFVPVLLGVMVSPTAGLIMVLLAAGNSTSKKKRLPRRLAPLPQIMMAGVVTAAMCINLIPIVERPSSAMQGLCVSLLLAALLVEVVPVRRHLVEKRSIAPETLVATHEPPRHVWLAATYVLIGAIAAQAQIRGVHGVLAQADKPQAFLTTVSVELVASTLCIVVYLFFVAEGNALLTGAIFPMMTLCPLVGAGVAFPLYLAYRESSLFGALQPSKLLLGQGMKKKARALALKLRQRRRAATEPLAAAAGPTTDVLADDDVRPPEDPTKELFVATEELFVSKLDEKDCPVAATSESEHGVTPLGMSLTLTPVSCDHDDFDSVRLHFTK